MHIFATMLLAFATSTCQAIYPLHGTRGPWRLPSSRLRPTRGQMPLTRYPLAWPPGDTRTRPLSRSTPAVRFISDGSRMRERRSRGDIFRPSPFISRPMSTARFGSGGRSRGPRRSTPSRFRTRPFSRPTFVSRPRPRGGTRDVRGRRFPSRRMAATGANRRAPRGRRFDSVRRRRPSSNADLNNGNRRSDIGLIGSIQATHPFVQSSVQRLGSIGSASRGRRLTSGSNRQSGTNFDQNNVNTLSDIGFVGSDSVRSMSIPSVDGQVGFVIDTPSARRRHSGRNSFSDVGLVDSNTGRRTFIPSTTGQFDSRRGRRRGVGLNRSDSFGLNNANNNRNNRRNSNINNAAILNGNDLTSLVPVGVAYEPFNRQFSNNDMILTSIPTRSIGTPMSRMQPLSSISTFNDLSFTNTDSSFNTNDPSRWNLNSLSRNAMSFNAGMHEARQNVLDMRNNMHEARLDALDARRDFLGDLRNAQADGIDTMMDMRSNRLELFNSGGSASMVNPYYPNGRVF